MVWYCEVLSSDAWFGNVRLGEVRCGMVITTTQLKKVLNGHRGFVITPDLVKKILNEIETEHINMDEYKHD